jgi:predicted enzyme related to lactoylglutathione lyase
MRSIQGGAVVYAKNLQLVARFYAEVCGLAETLRDDGYVTLECDGIELVVLEIPAHIANDIEIATPPLRREDTALKLMFVVDSIAAAREKARERGGVIDPADRQWEFRGMRVCDGHDPEGNVVQLRER